jgi:hypothetical protein
MAACRRCCARSSSSSNRYVFRLGFLDGVPGLIFFTLQTFWFHFFVDARIYERRLLDPR